jgi:hypothetical protein
MGKANEAMQEAVRLQQEATEELEAARAEQQRGAEAVSVELLKEAIEKEREAIEMQERALEEQRRALDERRAAFEEQKRQLAGMLEPHSGDDAE